MTAVGEGSRKWGWCLKETSEFIFCLIDLKLNWFRQHVIRVLKINDL